MVEVLLFEIYIASQSNDSKQLRCGISDTVLMPLPIFNHYFQALKDGRNKSGPDKGGYLLFNH